MKKSVKSKSTTFASGEHVRVVPLHHPKPSVAIGDLARTRREQEDGGDLFDGKPHSIAAGAHLNYNHGPLIPNVQVYTVFWGKLWGTTPSSTTMISKLNAFFKTILISPLIDQLAEYSVPGWTIGHGSLIGSKVIHTSAPVGSVTDSVIQAQLNLWIAGGVVPAPNKNTLYFI